MKNSPVALSRLTKAVLAPVGGALLLAGTAQATPYASHVVVSGTTVTFILNEPADALKYTVNGGPAQILDGSTKGTKTFSLTSPTDKFAIMAGKNSAVGYTIPTGATIAAVSTGLSQPTAAGGYNLISDDANTFNKYNSPRGVSVSTKPGAPNFGTVYIANSAAGTTGGRTLGDGLYALNADQSDAFGYGNTEQDPGNLFDALGASANSPFRVYAAPNGEVYVADFSDANSDVYRENGDLTAPTDGNGGTMLQTVGGPTTLPAGQNHGSTMAAYVEGSLAGGNLVLYTLDEDLTSPGGTDKNSLWRYDINAGPLPWASMPVKINQANILVVGATSDLQRGNDGKFYLNQNRSPGNEGGIIVLDASGVKVYDSLAASRALLANPSAIDILRNTVAVSVSEDQKWLTAMVNDSDVLVLPLTNGIPDLANRLLVDTGTDVVSGRDISFDAAGNIHYVSSGQGLYRVIAPGGISWATTARDGTTNTFTVVTGAPNLSTARNGNQITLTWPFGKLQQSSSVTGPWVDAPSQVSPYTVTPSGTTFYRIQGF